MSKGEKLRRLRESAGISQVEAAEKIGVSKQTLYKYEKNIISNIPSDVIERMASLYDTTPAYLMGWEDESGNILVETATVPKSNLSFDQISQAEYLYKLYEKATPEIQSAVDLLLQSAQNQQNKEIPHLVAEKPHAEIPYLKRDNK